MLPQNLLRVLALPALIIWLVVDNLDVMLNNHYMFTSKYIFMEIYFLPAI